MARKPSAVVDSQLPATSVEVPQGNNADQAELLKIIREMQNKINQLEKSVKTETVIEGGYSDENELENVVINPDKYVKVMSLCPHPLFLSTEKYGKGKIYEFKEFGEVRRIMYKHLLDIINAHENFVKQGKFYILNRAVIHENDLEETYSRILTKEGIETIVSGGDKDTTVSLFHSANDGQRNVICQMLLDKRIETPEKVDLNLWDKINRVVDGQLERNYQDAKQQFDNMNQLRKQEL